MGFDLVRISTSANGLRIPFDAKCCFCKLLLDDGISLSPCGHSACYECMSERARHTTTCAIDGLAFNPKQCRYLAPEIEDWLYDIKLKCRWFDGRYCTATGVALRNVHRHEDICPNSPYNTASNSRAKSGPERRVVVSDWVRRTGTAINFKTRVGSLGTGRAVPKICDTSKIEEWIKVPTALRKWSPVPARVPVVSMSAGRERRHTNT